MKIPHNNRRRYITHTIISILLVPMVSLAATSCATQQETPIERALRIEPMLSGAGFQAVPGDTPARKAQLQSLTPLEIRFTPYGGKMHYWFADPYHCKCIFSGNQDAYVAYLRVWDHQGIANQEEMTAQMNEAVAQKTMTFMVSPADEIFY
jgi:hypothetical protein